MISFPSSIGPYKIYNPLPTEGRNSVYYGTDEKGNKLAIKVSTNEYIVNEYKIMNEINNPYIIKAIDLIPKEPYHFLVMRMAKYDLYQFVKTTEYIDESIIKRIMYSILTALENLHSVGIWHRDIKPQNIFIFNEDGEFNCVLGDLEFAGYFRKQFPKRRCGTEKYFAPEIFSKSRYNHKIDLWAAGIVMYMIYKKMQFPFPNKACLMKGILLDTDGIPPLAQDLIHHLICVDPIKRYSAFQALHHPFFIENEVRETCNTVEDIASLLPKDITDFDGEILPPS